MIPVQWADRVEFGGNAALEGAHRLLVSAGARESAEVAVGSIETVDLAGSEGFQERFIGGLPFDGS